MNRDRISDITRRLEDRAEGVCRYYLSAGKRRGNYWQVGDVHNTPGQSMYVRLVSTPGKQAGKWHDAATAEHGDLLDIIRETCGLTEFADVMEEAEWFLGVPPNPSAYNVMRKRRDSIPTSPPSDAARNLFAMSKPIAGTLAETFLARRSITRLDGLNSLRFHPRCYYRPEDDGPTEQWPAMIAAVTDLENSITGVHRTWLARDGSGKAPLDPPRKAIGRLNGNAVRFGKAGNVLLAGEGIETVLSLRQFMPSLPMAACLSTSHLAALRFSPDLERLYIACDHDDPGIAAGKALAVRATSLSIEAILLLPILADFNEDLCQLPAGQFLDNLRSQMARQDFACFLDLPGHVA